MVSGGETLPPDGDGFAPGEDLARFCTSCALIPAEAQSHLPPVTPGGRARLSPAAMPGSSGDAAGMLGERSKGDVPEDQMAATAPETPWGQSRRDCWALPLPKPFPGCKLSVRADPGSTTSPSPAAA